jgi:hypothetical protein
LFGIETVIFSAKISQKAMKKLFPMLAGVSLTLGLISCNQQHGMDDKTVQHRTDSAYAAQRQTVIDEMNKTCADNMAANVQMKADSIVNAGQAAKQPM